MGQRRSRRSLQKSIRPTPYSTNMATNPSTYDSIKNAAVPRGGGYVRATMLWEGYAALVNKHGFNPDIYGDWRSGGTTSRCNSSWSA